MTNPLSRNNNRRDINSNISSSNNNNHNADSTISATSTSAVITPPITTLNNNKIRNIRRVSCVKVSKNCSGGIYEKQNPTRKRCPKCKESSSNVEILKNQVCQIEKMVNAIAEKTQNMANYSQRDNQPRKWKFRGIDLTTSSLEEIQNLVLETTKIGLPLSSSSNNDISNSSIESSSSTSMRKKTVDLNTSSQLIITKPLHSEPYQTIEEEVKVGPTQNIRNDSSHRQCYPMHSNFSNNINQALRHDSGFGESRQNTDPTVHQKHQQSKQQDCNQSSD